MMNAQIITTFILYLIIFRVAMITAGIISTILGYKLFVKGVFAQTGNGTGTDIEGESVGIKFTLKNAAPGTAFALFGVLIISIMFISGPPELTLEHVYKPEMVTLKSDSFLVSQKWQLRSEATDSLPLALDRAIQAQQAKDTTTALVEYKNAIKAATLALNQAAWLLHARGDQDNAYALARTAMFVSPADADIQDTYAEILLSKGDYYQALEHAKKAAEFNQKYAVKIKKYRDAYEKVSKE